MILDMSLVTFALLGVLLLFAILSRIWRDQTMGIPQADEADASKLAVNRSKKQRDACRCGFAGDPD